VTVVKTRLQAQSTGAPAYTGTLHAIRSIWAREGARGFFKGFGTSTLNLAVGQLYISVFERLRSGDVAALNGMSEAYRTALAACSAVLLAQTVSNPIDVVSQKLMVDTGVASPAGRAGAQAAAGAGREGARAGGAQAPKWGGEPMRVVRQVLAERGFAGMYRGYWASVAQMAPGSTMWWTSYGMYRKALLTAAGPEHSSTRARLVEVASGAMAGTTVAVLANPLDVLRTRVQVHGTPLLQAMRTLFLVEGTRGLTAGMVARVATMAPNGALVMSAYEFIKRSSLTDDARARRYGDRPTRDL